MRADSLIECGHFVLCRLLARILTRSQKRLIPIKDAAFKLRDEVAAQRGPFVHMVNPVKAGCMLIAP